VQLYHIFTGNHKQLVEKIKNGMRNLKHV